MDADLPREFFTLPADPRTGLAINKLKFPESMWQKLKDRGFAVQGHPWTLGDTYLAKHFGLFMMSVLARECAGNAYVPVTDEVSGYESNARIVSAGTPENLNTAEQAALHDLNIPFFDPSQFSLGDLVRMRQRERTNNADGAAIRDMRHRFLESMRKFGTDLLSADAADRVELIRQYDQKMEDDAVLLQEALKQRRNEEFFSSEVKMAALGLLAAGTAVATGGLATVPAAATIGLVAAGIGGGAVGIERCWAMMGRLSKYKVDREEIINKSTVGYLFAAHEASRKPWFKTK